MAITYPYGVSTFADVMKIKSAVFQPSYGQEYSGQASGIIIAKDLRPALWSADITTVDMRWDQANDLQALIEGLRGSIQTFYLYNPMRPYPKVGASTHEATSQINTLGSDGTSLSLKGLGAAQVVTRGDMISFQYGSRPSRALHRVLETVTANGSGVTSEFQIQPAVRTGAVTSTAVLLNKAYGEFRLTSTFIQNVSSTVTVNYQIKAIQVL
jgi:hypothetical protein